jgi:TM2 domain-containing membrane protein YozV
MFCSHCGNEIAPHAVVCIRCGGASAAQASVPAAASAASKIPKSRVAYVLLGLFLGAFGIHNFYAGYAGRGVAQLLITLLTGWLIVPLIAVWIWVIIEICTTDRDPQGLAFT